MAPWTKVSLNGDVHMMPAVCPNCLGAGECDYRVPYRLPMPLYLVDRVTYFQTFRYCKKCGNTLDAWFKYKRTAGNLAFLSFIVLLGTLFLCAFLDSHHPQNGATFPAFRSFILAISEPVFFIASECLALGLLVWLWTSIKKRAYSRAPLLPQQATWGPAAYFRGSSFSSKSTYMALRPEWIQALVRANPDQVSDDVYRRIVGEPKPVAAERPFA